MRIDSARNQQEAGGINDFVRGAGRNSRAHFLDYCAVDQQIRFYAGVGVYYGSVLNKCFHDGIFLISYRSESQASDPGAIPGTVCNLRIEKQPQVLRLRLPQKARQTSLRMTACGLSELQTRHARLLIPSLHWLAPRTPRPWFAAPRSPERHPYPRAPW